ncbi:hypothetical protein QTP88_004512 [Uroleucon formosanum]
MTLQNIKTHLKMSYTAITVHFIDQNCELKSNLLSCAKFPMRHTSENIKDCLQNIVRQWGSQNKIAASLILLFNLFWTKSKKLELKLKALSSTLKEVHSPLKMKEQLGYSPVHTLIQDVVTPDLNYDVSLTSDDWQIISKSCDIVKRFEEITIEMSNEKGVTISKTILFTQALINFCNKLMTQHQTIPCIDSFIHKLTEETNKRFGQLENDMLLAVATFLDPRFKKYGFKNHFAFQDTKRSIVNKGKIIISEKNVQQRNLTTYPIPPTASNKEDSIWKLLI